MAMPSRKDAEAVCGLACASVDVPLAGSGTVGAGWLASMLGSSRPELSVMACFCSATKRSAKRRRLFFDKVLRVVRGGALRDESAEVGDGEERAGVGGSGPSGSSSSGSGSLIFSGCLRGLPRLRANVCGAAAGVEAGVDAAEDGAVAVDWAATGAGAALLWILRTSSSARWGGSLRVLAMGQDSLGQEVAAGVMAAGVGWAESSSDSPAIDCDRSSSGVRDDGSLHAPGLAIKTVPTEASIRPFGAVCSAVLLSASQRLPRSWSPDP
ncbi:hypothetical protein L1887_58863 [Cichorium endivia]|nr:hypothetical protein L1887_58863 [Cichorium endivia]